MATQYIDYAGYGGCIALDNGDTRVVLGPHCGGRVLSYTWKGREALWLDPAHDGWEAAPGRAPLGMLFPSGGRFDIGPEHTIPKHPDLWFGPWQGEILDESSARMTSVESPAVGVRLGRDFALASSSSRLRCTQTMTNVSDRETRWCYWARSFGRGHGICIVPLTAELSRYPRQYVMYGPGSVIDYQPEDPAIRIREGFLEVLDTPARPKLGIDSHAGWFAYLMPHDLLLIKRFPTYPRRAYGEIAGLTLSLWYYKDVVCELEPIGPTESLAPGESASFTEDWWLVPYPFPEQRDALDILGVAAVARQAMAS